MPVINPLAYDYFNDYQKRKQGDPNVNFDLSRNDIAYYEQAPKFNLRKLLETRSQTVTEESDLQVLLLSHKLRATEREINYNQILDSLIYIFTDE